jgi:predicted neuraminidase
MHRYFLPLFLLLPESLLAAEKPPCEVVARAVVYQHPAATLGVENTSAFNHGPSIALQPNGHLLAVWFSAVSEGHESQRIMRAVSTDHGLSWSKAEVLQDFPGRADFDPALLVAGQQTLLFFSAASPLRIYARRSADLGQTWAEPVELGQPNHTTRANPIQLATGELLAPLHLRGTKGAGVMKSTDGGATWKRCGAVTTPLGEGGEPSIAQAKSGQVLMTLRTKDGELWISRSTDRGETWGPPEKSGLTATTSASHLLALRDGTIVLTYNPDRNELRFPLVLRVSKDEGRTWSEPAIVADRPAPKPGWSICYPSATELPDGTLALIWTQIRDIPGTLHGDIHAARLRLTDR